MEECSERHKDLHGMMEPSSTRNSSERCPCPLNSQDYTQEDHNYTYHNQGEDLMDIKVEIKAEEEETYVRDDQQSMKEDGIAGSFIEEDTPTEISTVHGWGMRKSSEDCLILSPDCKSEDEDITQYCLGEKPASSNAHLEEPHNVKDSAVLQTDNRFSCTGGHVHKDLTWVNGCICVPSARNFLSQNVIWTDTKAATQVRSLISALSAGNVFWIIPLLPNIRILT